MVQSIIPRVARTLPGGGLGVRQSRPCETCCFERLLQRRKVLDELGLASGWEPSSGSDSTVRRAARRSALACAFSSFWRSRSRSPAELGIRMTPADPIGAHEENRSGGRGSFRNGREQKTRDGFDEAIDGAGLRSHRANSEGLERATPTESRRLDRRYQPPAAEPHSTRPRLQSSPGDPRIGAVRVDPRRSCTSTCATLEPRTTGECPLSCRRCVACQAHETSIESAIFPLGPTGAS